MNTWLLLDPSMVVGGLTVNAGAEPVVIATVGEAIAVLVPCIVAIPDCAAGEADAVMVMVQVPSGAMLPQPLYTGGPANCACTLAGILIVTLVAAIVELVLVIVKICELFACKKVVGGLAVNTGARSSTNLP